MQNRLGRNKSTREEEELMSGWKLEIEFTLGFLGVTSIQRGIPLTSIVTDVARFFILPSSTLHYLQVFRSKV
jgi:hypothetical protein